MNAETALTRAECLLGSALEEVCQGHRPTKLITEAIHLVKMARALVSKEKVQ